MQPLRKAPIFALSILAAVSVATSAWAQAIDVPLLVTGDSDKRSWANIAVGHQFKTEIDSGNDGSDADFSRNNLSAVVGHRFELDDNLFLLGNMAYQLSFYDFDNGFGPRTQLRWQDIHRFTLMTGLGWTQDEWTVIGLLIGRTEGESGANFKETLTGGGGILVEYQWSDTLRTGFLLGGMSALDRDAALIPLPTVSWDFAESWNFHLGIVNAAGYPGIGSEVSYRGEDLSLGFGASFQNRRYRLDRRTEGSATPGRTTNDGIGQERSLPVYARAAYRVNENLNLGAMVGVVLAGSIRSATDSDRIVFEEDYDPAPIVGLNANFIW